MFSYLVKKCDQKIMRINKIWNVKIFLLIGFSLTISSCETKIQRPLHSQPKYTSNPNDIGMVQTITRINDTLWNYSTNKWTFEGILILKQYKETDVEMLFIILDRLDDDSSMEGFGLLESLSTYPNIRKTGEWKRGGDKGSSTEYYVYEDGNVLKYRHEFGKNEPLDLFPNVKKEDYPVKSEGYFKNNLRDGDWYDYVGIDYYKQLEFYSEGKLVRSESEFEMTAFDLDGNITTYLSVFKTERCILNSDWVTPSKTNYLSAFKFNRNRTFNYSTKMFGGMYASGEWEIENLNQIRLIYKSTNAGYLPEDQVVTIDYTSLSEDCGNILVGKTVYHKI